MTHRTPMDPETLADARKVLSDMGLADARVTLLGSGATSRVWTVATPERTCVLRLIDGDRGLYGALDAHIRQSLRDLGGRAVPPLATSDVHDLRIAGRRWSLEPYVPGFHPARGALPCPAARHLGETLAALHALPVAGFGRPVARDGSRIKGGAATPLAGVADRFENPLPDLWAQGYTHPVLAAAPDLRPALLAHLAQVSSRIATSAPVLCHGDLHERQFICSGDGLAALIDFGEAAVLDPHWDLGSVWYFHGARDFAMVHAAYAACTTRRDILPEAARAFSIAIAMHHASRARLPGRAHRLARATAHIRATLAEAP